MPNGDLLRQAMDFFKRRGTEIKTVYDDDRGRYAFRVDPDELADQYIVTAKGYLHAGDASFMEKKVVRRAIDYGAMLLLYVDDGEYWYVFDPEAVHDYGVEPDPEDSPRARSEDWLDIDAGFGVSFEDYVEGRAAPKRHPDDPDADDQKDPNTSLDDYGGKA